MNISWDSDSYTDNFDFVHRYGEDVLGLISAPEGSRVIDLGCGNGALTEKLFNMGFDVIGLDASDDMIEKARSMHPDLRFEKADALDFSLEAPADVIFSNAVFHWIDRDKQSIMLGNIAKNLKQGGSLVCEFGGLGCGESVHSALKQEFAEHGLDYKNPFFFPDIAEFSALLKAAGLRVKYAVLFDRPTLQKGENGVADWIKMFVKAPFCDLDSDLSDEIIYAAQERTRCELLTENGWIVDYVRIRAVAIKL